MFKGDTLLKDEAAKYAADRIALRANTPLAQGLNEMTRKFHGLACSSHSQGLKLTSLILLMNRSRCRSVLSNRTSIN